MENFLRIIGIIGIIVISNFLIVCLSEQILNYLLLGVLICGLILSFLLLGLVEVIVVLKNIRTDTAKLQMKNNIPTNTD